MSKTKPVGLYGGGWRSRPDPQRQILAYDAALAIVLAEVIHTVEDKPGQDRPDWWADCQRELRVQCAISDCAFDIDLGLTHVAREQFAVLLEDAADALLKRQTVTHEEVAGRPILDDLPAIFRGEGPQDCRPISELGRALAALIRGSLPAAPPQSMWFYGAPGGRTTIGLRPCDGDDTDHSESR